MRPQVHGSQAGFSLITACIVLTVAALVMVSMLPGNKAGDTSQKYTSTEQRMEKVQEAMRAFMIQNGRMPCPADGSAAPNTATFGVEAINAGNCTITAGTMGPDAVTSEIISGVIPTRTLGLSDDYAYDAWGRRLDYVVDIRATSHGTCNSLTTGGITIVNTTVSGATTDNTMYAFISHGPDGHGAFPAQGSTVGNRINAGSTDADKNNNAGVSNDGHFTYNTANFTATKVLKAPTSSFKDLVWYRQDLKNVCCIGPSCATGGGGNVCTPNANQGGGTMLNGSTRPEYKNSSGLTCPSEVMSCNGGKLSCSVGTMTSDCQYANCILTPPGCSTASPGGPLNSTFSPTAITSGTNQNAYVAANDPTCAATTLNCTNGTLTCGGSGTLTNCMYSSCVKQCTLPWGGTINGQAPSNTVTAYNATTVAYPATCSSTTLTCTNGSLSGTSGYIYQSCNQTGAPCTLSGNQGGGTLNSGSTMPAFANSSSPCVQATLSCSNGTLNCSTGQMSDCTYSACSAGGGSSSSSNIWVVDTLNNRVQQFNSSGTYLSQFGSLPPIDGTFMQPFGIAFDSGGNVWVADQSNNRVQKFSSSGTFLLGIGAGYNGVSGAVGSSGSGNGQFNIPRYIAFDSGGNVWVTDYFNNRVQQFSSGGNFLMGLGSGYNGVAGSIGSSGNGNGQFFEPSGITIDSGGNLWVADTVNQRVEEISSSGTYLNKISYGAGSGSGQFSTPQGIAITGGNLWVADSGNNRVQEFSSSGTYLSQFGAFGNGNGQFENPTDIAIDSGGNLWVTDSNNGRVQQLNTSGTMLLKVGTFGSGNGQFNGIFGIAIASGSGNVWVVDKGNFRVEQFSSTGTYLSQFGTRSYLQNGALYQPYVGIAVDNGGNLWVSDTGNNRVQQFNSSGTYLMALGSGYNGVAGSIGSIGSGNGQFNQPYGLAIDGGGNIWVMDYNNNRVEEFSSGGTWLGKFGSMGYANGQLWNAKGLAIDGSGNLWIADGSNNRLQQFNPGGTWLLTIPGGCASSSPSGCATSIGNGQFNFPIGITIDSGGNIWVADTNNSRVQELSSTGTFLMGLGSGYNGVTGSIGSVGTGNGQFDSSSPQGISIDSGGNVWVADVYNSRVEEFSSGGTWLSKFGSYGSGNGKLDDETGIILNIPTQLSCTLLWGGTLNSGQNISAYGSNEVAPGNSCTANTLSCNNGTLTCNLSGGGSGVVGTDCKYQSCYVECNLPWGGTLNGNGATTTAAQSATVAYPGTCNWQTLTCNNGVLSGSYTFPSCSVTGTPCQGTGSLSWVSLSDGGTTTSYEFSNATVPTYTCAGTTDTITCTNGTLSSLHGYTNQNCEEVCTLTTNQGGGVLYDLAANGPTTKPEFTSATVARPATCDNNGNGNTMTCTQASGLTCATNNMANCQYSPCTSGLDMKINGTSGALGYAVATGDINGDGYTDLIIGAPNASPNGVSNAGSVYVLLGSATGIPTTLASLNGANGFELDGAVTNSEAGASLAVGDVNGDGYGDIIIGAKNANSVAGYTYVVFGNAAGGVAKKKDGTAWATTQTLAAGTGGLVNGTNGVRFDGQTANDVSGYAVASGDVNGDGKADIAIGAYNASYGAVNSGSVYLIYGASPLLPVTTVSTTNASTSATVASAAGLIVGQTVSSTNIPAGTTITAIAGTTITLSNAATATAAGTAFSVASVILNTTYVNATNAIRFDSSTASAGAGNSVAIGDIDGDGDADVVIGAPSAGVAGYVYTVYGHADVGGVHKNKSAASWASTNTLSTVCAGTNGMILLGATASDHVGQSVAVGDINGDGYGDIIAGAYMASYGAANSGSVYVVFGGADAAGVPQMKNGTAWVAAGNSLAASSATTGVLNGLNGVRFDGQSAGDNVGYSVTASDFNGDGKADIMAGAYMASAYTANHAGSAYVIFGAGTPLPQTTITTTHNSTTATVASATGLIVGQTISSANVPAGTTISAIAGTTLTLSNKASASAAGTAMQIASTILNTTFINGTNGFRLDDGTASEEAGYSIAAGDFNGTKNGIHNLYGIAIGAPFASGANGAVFIVNGMTTGWASTQTLQ